MQESVPLDDDDLQKWLSKYITENKKIRRSYLSKRDRYLSEDDYDPEAAELFKSYADIALGRILTAELVQSRTKKEDK